jgi:hypothetical protein
MSRSQKPRHKKRTPIYVNPNACMIALERFKVLRKPVDEEFASSFDLAALTALDAVARGVGTTDQWDTLSRCINQAWLLARGGCGTEATPALVAAQEAMKRMIPGFRANRKLLFVSDADLRAVEAALSLWAEQIRLTTIGEFTAATELVEREYWTHREAA